MMILLMLHMDFLLKGSFSEGLKTIISLITKVTTPSKVTDYRPISCCNVLYKCISKIISERLRIGLTDVVDLN